MWTPEEQIVMRRVRAMVNVRLQFKAAGFYNPDPILVSYSDEETIYNAFMREYERLPFADSNGNLYFRGETIRGAFA